MLSRLISAFWQAIAQLRDRRVLNILLMALAIAVIATGPFLILIIAVAAIIDWLPLPAGIGGEGSWISWSSRLFWTYLISPLTVAIIGALLDSIVNAVEAKHYPDLPSVRRRSLSDTILYAIRFLFLMLGVSIVAWLCTWITGLSATIVFMVGSGYLIAREYFETVALRRMDEFDAKKAVSDNLPTLWVAGIVVALGLTVPVLNLIAPLVGAAAFTHLFHTRPPSY